MKVEENIAQLTLQAIGGKHNLLAVQSTATETQLIVSSMPTVLFERLQKLPWFVGYQTRDEQHHITVDNRYHEVWWSLSAFAFGHAPALEPSEKPSSWKTILATFTNIFMPLIPAFVASGVLEAIYSILAKYKTANWLPNSLVNGLVLVDILGKTTLSTLHILIGMSTMQALGGSLALGAVVSAVLYHPGLNGVQFSGVLLASGRGGVLAILMACGLASYLEKWCRRHLPTNYVILGLPPIVVSVTCLVGVFCIQPAAAWIAELLLQIVQLSLSQPHRWIAGGFLAGFFSSLVPWGLHHGFIPLYERMMQTQGVNCLTPIFAMADMGQIGAALALSPKLKNLKIKRILSGAILSACLGIGEPLLFGVSLPLMIPLFTGSLGSVVGGALISYWGLQSKVSFGVAGFPLGATFSLWDACRFFIASGITIVSAGLLTALVWHFSPKRQEAINGE